MDVQELFHKRVLCKYFKSLIDNNLKYFYNNFSKIHPKSFCKINNKVTIENFIKGGTNQYIENFSKYNCSPFYINKIKNDNTTYSQAKLILNLYKHHNIEFYSGINCINFNSQQIDQMLKLKDIGIPIFFCIYFSEETIYTKKQINEFKKLKQMNVSEFYSNQIILTFTDERLEYFYKLVNNDMWFVHAIHLAKEKVF